MKLFGVLLLLCAAICYVRCEELTKENALLVANACKEEAGATDDDIGAMLKHEPAGSQEAKCMRACVMKRFNTLTADGKLNREGALAFGKLISKGDADKEQKAAEIVDACEAIEVSDDHCEAAEQYGACIKEQAIARGWTAESLQL